MDTYPVVIVAAGDNYLEEIGRLPAVATLAEAIESARAAGYTIPDDLADASETNDTWTPNDPGAGTGGEMMHLVMVLPPTD